MNGSLESLTTSEPPSLNTGGGVERIDIVGADIDLPICHCNAGQIARTDFTTPALLASGRIDSKHHAGALDENRSTGNRTCRKEPGL